VLAVSHAKGERKHGAGRARSDWSDGQGGIRAGRRMSGHEGPDIRRRR